jgi:glycine/D-amino acid oxidase-like deaminating enzyme
MAQFGIKGLELHRQLARQLPDESGVDYHFADTTIVRPAFSDEEELSLKKIIAKQKQLGLNLSWQTKNELNTLDIPINNTAHGAIVSEGEAQVEPYRLVLAFAQAMERFGGTITYGTVNGLLYKKETVTGVVLSSGSTINAGSVVLGLGPWSSASEQWSGYPTPIKPLKGQLLRLQTPKQSSSYAIFHKGNYVLSKPAGYTIAGTTEELVGFDTAVTPQAQEAIIHNALHLVPDLVNSSLIGAHACLRPLSSDDIPILGPIPGWKNLFIATGHGRKGILLSAITGQIIADLIIKEETTLTDITPFLPQRFKQ